MRTAHPAGPALARALLLGMLAFPLVLSAQAAEPAPPAGVEKVDINTADEAALAAALKGVGLRKAAAIIEYREQHGGFRTIDELANVRGIGLNMYEKSKYVKKSVIANHANTGIIIAIVIGIIIVTGFILYEERNRISKEFYKLKNK